ncbi:MAG: glutamate 5-kinase [Pseudomonadota bacterium]
MIRSSTELGLSKRWVIKIGSSLVTNNGRGLNTKQIQNWADQINELIQSGKEVVIVSSGAIAEGMNRLGWETRPEALHELQAAAAVGQMGLIQAYEVALAKHNLHSAQVLLTHDDMMDRRRYLNAKTTLRKLLELKTIPVVNENDTISTEEIELGDNDTLASLVANLVEADLMIILTDVEGLYSGNPKDKPNAKLIEEINVNDPALEEYAGHSKGEFGRGGMKTKILAAKRAARSGACAWIANGEEKDILQKITMGKKYGTRILAETEPLNARKQWIANHLKAKGTVVIDSGASKVISKFGKSLLAVGVSRVKGDFERGDVVKCVDSSGTEIALGLINYNASETKKIIGKSSDEIFQVLGFVGEPELIHRDNLVLL